MKTLLKSLYAKMKVINQIFIFILLGVVLYTTISELISLRKFSLDTKPGDEYRRRSITLPMAIDNNNLILHKKDGFYEYRIPGIRKELALSGELHTEFSSVITVNKNKELDTLISGNFTRLSHYGSSLLIAENETYQDTVDSKTVIHGISLLQVDLENGHSKKLCTGDTILLDYQILNENDILLTFALDTDSDTIVTEGEEEIKTGIRSVLTSKEVPEDQ